MFLQNLDLAAPMRTWRYTPPPFGKNPTNQPKWANSPVQTNFPGVFIVALLCKRGKSGFIAASEYDLASPVRDFGSHPLRSER